MRRLSLLLESIDTGSSILYIRDGEPIYYYGSHEMWNIIGGPQKLTNFILIFYYCDRKSRAACAQSFALWQQATIEIMLAISIIIACSRYIYYGVILHAHPVRGESHNQRNTTGEVATTSPPFYNEPHRSHVLCVKAELRMSFTPWSQHHFIAIGNPEQHVRKASHCGRKQQWRSCSQSLLLLLARASYIMVLFFTHILFVVNHTINATPPERLQHYLYLPKENKERKPCHGTMEASFDLLSTCLLIKKFHCDATLCSNLGNEKSNAGHIKCSRGPQAPHPTKHDNAQIKSPSMLSLRLYFVFMATRTACLPLNALSNCIVHNGKLCGNFHVAIISNT